ncbi:DUF4124 domain-containing protein [Vibrio cincinnatiensis]|uniref:DUF4124 domain-containing protein n=1 Tax=Vibrio cincinnatiensis DSM 19608 TaxID=1123491 RepID=A0A1T4RUR6_VIBCI|nr:DUF4124 domain-containing protein [Vibrio cincinnatiensis]MCG3758693.1 DUF4124 domain-containing protein [Vibrio cincinnatiensis]MCG3761968.1 DUF4124 domain-containing protein [Vibrio cincinnatiensis]SKA19341.1 protein of unknown function [Vibrio cincinnatiensis DSM 19608]SUP47407.1 nitrogen regulation protein NR [Vibrio cincinnatiensis]
MKWFPIISMLLTSLYNCNLYASNAYIWEDENGVIHFSDFPQSPVAQSVSLPDHNASAPAPKFEEPEPIDPPSTQLATKNNKAPLPDLNIDIIHPTQEQTIRSNKGEIHIVSRLNRNLQVSEHLQLFVNGKPYGAPTTLPEWELKNIDRGTHLFMIQAVVNGKVIALSKPVTVHLHRASVN